MEIQAEAEQVPDGREPYEAPQIEESGRFEHLVLSCGKTQESGLFDCIEYGFIS